MSASADATGAVARPPRRVLVAGAGGGIGRACVERLTAAGAHVHGVDREDADGTGAAESRRGGLPALDVTRPGVAEEAVAAAEARLGGLDGVVHAVGMSGRALGDGPVSTCTDEAWDEVLRVNLGSAFRLLRAALPVLRGAGGGSVVLVGSVTARTTDPDFLTAAYAASKGGLESLARVAAREGAADGVRVNVVAPALVRTPMARRATEDPDIQDRLAELQPLGGTMLEPGEVADAVVWLLSDAARRVTGTVLPVDAGWLL